jgi:hypothetical protein
MEASDIVALTVDAWLRVKGYPPHLTSSATEAV